MTYYCMHFKNLILSHAVQESNRLCVVTMPGHYSARRVARICMLLNVRTVLIPNGALGLHVNR